MWAEDYLESMSVGRLLDAIIESRQVVANTSSVSQSRLFIVYAAQEMCELLRRVHDPESQ
jgi:hypothetical protein